MTFGGVTMAKKLFPNEPIEKEKWPALTEDLAFPEGRYAMIGQGLNKQFGSLKVLTDLSIAVPRGSTYCLLGPNGSGKTTLIRIAVGLMRHDSGRLYVLDRPVSEVQEIYPRIGYMTQHKALYPDLTLQENMEFFAGLYGIDGQKRQSRIDELLDMVDLASHRNRLTGDLSGGMYQRLSLASTLIHEPDLLLLDEPTVGVDPRLRQTFWDYFNHLTEGGVTILITTHLMDEAERCKIVGYMRAGRMQAVGSPEEIKSLAGLRPTLKLWAKNPEEAASRLRALGFDARVADKGKELQVSLDSHSRIKEVLNEVNPEDVRLIEPTLAEAFLKLSGEPDKRSESDKTRKPDEPRGPEKPEEGRK
jgi:ABC-2 type transport system ATP-binding protein